MSTREKRIRARLGILGVEQMRRGEVKPEAGVGHFTQMGEYNPRLYWEYQEQHRWKRFFPIVMKYASFSL